MRLFALGINHQTAPVDLRERVAFDSDMLAPALAALCTSCEEVDGVVPSSGYEDSLTA